MNSALATTQHSSVTNSLNSAMYLTLQQLRKNEAVHDMKDRVRDSF